MTHSETNKPRRIDDHIPTPLEIAAHKFLHMRDRVDGRLKTISELKEVFKNIMSAIEGNTFPELNGYVIRTLDNLPTTLLSMEEVVQACQAEETYFALADKLILGRKDIIKKYVELRAAVMISFADKISLFPELKVDKSDEVQTIEDTSEKRELFTFPTLTIFEALPLQKKRRPR